jgi:hypothetical protein
MKRILHSSNIEVKDDATIYVSDYVVGLYFRQSKPSSSAARWYRRSIAMRSGISCVLSAGRRWLVGLVAEGNRSAPCRSDTDHVVDG